MKVKVIKEFVDKHTNKLHKVNEVFECTEDRYNEIMGAGSYVEPVPVTKKAEKGTETE